MQVRCPNCENTLDVGADETLDSAMNCPSCGSQFHLSGGGEETIDIETTRIAHFELVQQLGVGAFGAVWRAKDTQLDRYVAIKIPRQGQFDKRSSAQFLREAQASAQLQHRNIVSIHEVGRHEDLIYIVSEFIDGTTLADRLTAWRPTSRESSELCAKIADGLQHAHEAGVIHRDLKPANIMVDLDGEPRVTDFGLALRESSADVTVSVAGKIMGTPAYMPPEQARGEGNTADRRADIYALGVILFELLTGECPFRGNAQMLLHQVLHDEPPSPRKLNSAIPRDLETIVLKCLSKAPASRYATADELAKDLRRWLNREPIQARPVGPVGKTVRWCQRRPAIAGLIGLVVVVAVAGFVGVDSQRRRAVTNFRRSEELREEAERNYQESERQRVRRQANYERAVDAVDRMLTRVAQQRLMNTPEMSATRRLLLEDAVAFYQELVTDESEDPDLQAETGLAHSRVGGLQSLLDDLDAAIASFEESTRILTALVEQYPDREKYRRALSQAEVDLGAVYSRRGESEQAIAQQFKGLKHSRHLSEGDPANETYRVDVAARLTAIAGLYRIQNRMEDSEEVYKEAQELFESVGPDALVNPISMRNHAYAYYGNAVICGLTSRPESAETLYRKAISIYDKVFEKEPDNESFRNEYWDFKRGLAVTLISLGKSEDAESVFQELTEARRTLVRKFPRIPSYRQNLSKSFNDLGIMYARSGRLDKASEALSEGVKVNEQLAADQPEIVEYRRSLAYDYNNLAVVHQQRGQDAESINYHRKAYATRKKLVDDAPENQAFLAELAISTANLGDVLQSSVGSEKEAERLLRESIQIGIRLVEQSPSIVSQRHKLAIAHRSLANLLIGQNNEEAEQHLQESLVLLSELAEKLTEDPRYDQQRAFSFDKLGEVFLSMQKDDQAETAFRQAKAILKELEENFDQRFELRQNHVMGTRKLARVLDLIGKHQEAKETYLRCLEMWRELQDELPDNPMTIRELAKSRNSFAMFLLTCPEVGLRDPTFAEELAAAAVETEPSEPDYWNTLALARLGLSQTDKAEQATHEVSKLVGNDLTENDLLIQSMVLHRQGKHEASKQFRALAVERSKEEVQDRFTSESFARLLEPTP